MQVLTQKQRELFHFIKSYISKNQLSPSFGEIQNHFGFASLSSVYKYLQVLRQKGFINIKRNSARSISLINIPSNPGPTRNLQLPFLGYLCEGGEVETIEGDRKISFALNKKISPTCYFLKVKGIDFQEAGLLNNDLIIIEPRSEARVGEIIFASVYQEQMVIKKYFPKGPYVRLESMTVDMEPLMVLPEEISIQGVLLGMIRHF